MTRVKLSLEETFDAQLRAEGITGYVRQFTFLPGRRYKADFAFLAKRLIIEIDGGQWVRGTGHNSGTGKERDCIRDAEAQIAGWNVIRVTTRLVENGEGLALVLRFFRSRQ